MRWGVVCCDCARHYEGSEEQSLFHGLLDVAVFEHVDVVWQLCAGLDGDEV
jgi:hypothetical protein